MTRIERLLAATDLSAPARHAAERAALVARQLRARLELVHVISTSPVARLRRLMQAAPADLEQQVRERAGAELGRLAESLRPSCGDIPGTAVCVGELLGELERRVAAVGADLLVLGARGTNFMRHRLLGSTAERIVRKSPVPLLVVRQPPHEPYRRVLVAVDFSPSSLPALEAARAVAPGAEVTLLHACTVPFEDSLRSAGVGEQALEHYRLAARRQALVDMEALLSAAGASAGPTVPRVLEGDATSHILEQEQELEADLIVVGKHGESTLEDLLLGSVTRHVLQESQGDVLVAVTLRSASPLLGERPA